MQQLDLGVMFCASISTALVVTVIAPKWGPLCGIVAGVVAGVLEAWFRRDDDE